MNLLIAVDPGKTHYGFASFAGTELEWAILVERDKLEGWLEGTEAYSRPPYRLKGYDRIVVEKPQRQHRTVSVNDIIEVALAAGEAGAALRQFCGGTIEYVRPDAWGGTTPKPIKNKRALEKLTKIERARIFMPSAEKTLGHNILDSVGLGLWATGRVKRTGR